jgi:hypothetical protein
MPFRKGDRGNPYGRPPKERALTTILEKLGQQPVLADAHGQVVDAKTFVAARVWDLLTTGQVILGERVLQLDGGKEWFEVARWLYAHVDGPPRPVPETTERHYLEELAAILRGIYAEQRPGQGTPSTPAEASGLTA